MEEMAAVISVIVAALSTGGAGSDQVIKHDRGTFWYGRVACYSGGLSLKIQTRKDARPTILGPENTCRVSPQATPTCLFLQLGKAAVSDKAEPHDPG